jgi:hypothetical protein
MCMGRQFPETETNQMNAPLMKQVEQLRTAPMASVSEKYRALFGEEPRSKHRESLVRRIAWRMQAESEGGLSERARQRALAMARDADLRRLPPRDAAAMLNNSRWDSRIPRPGAMLKRDFRGRNIAVKVLVDGFEYDGKRYSSLSAIATEVTGTRWNGLAFFGLTVQTASRSVR